MSNSSGPLVPAEVAALEEQRQALGVAEVATAAEPIAGGWMSYEAPDSWANQACGLGMKGPVSEEDLDRLVAFYASRGVPATVEVCPYAHATLLAGLARRGFALEEFSLALGRPLRDQEEDLDALLRGAAPAGLEIVPVDPDDRDELRAFIETSTSGFRPAEEPMPRPLFDLTRRVAEHPRCQALLALVDGEPAGGGLVETFGSLAALYGTSVLPAFQRRGIQRALILRRLAWARERGCEVATIQSSPGIATERNALRDGFAPLYSRASLKR